LELTFGGTTLLKERFSAMVAICLLTLCLASTPVRAVERCVLVELLTHISCPGCDHAKAALDSLTDEYPDSAVTIIRYHPFEADPFFQQEAFNRAYYYLLGEIPMAVFGGVDKVIGATPDSAYLKYKANIEAHRIIPSPLSMNMAVTYDTLSREGQAIVQVQAVDSVHCGDLRLRYALLESELPYSSEVHDEILRDMYPADAGVGFNIQQGETYVDTMDFTLDPQWLPENCDLVAFAQCDIGNYLLQSIQRRIPLPCPPTAVEDVEIVLCRPHLLLTWSPVMQNQAGEPISVDYYRVFRDTVLTSDIGSKTLIDSTYLPSFMDTSAGYVGDSEVNYSYFITAVAGGMESDPSDVVGEFDMLQENVK
jgi:hypothetical protein